MSFPEMQHFSGFSRKTAGWRVVTRSAALTWDGKSRTHVAARSLAGVFTRDFGDASGRRCTDGRQRENLDIDAASEMSQRDDVGSLDAGGAQKSLVQKE